MLRNKKHVFWEALLITIVIFAFGFLLGMGFESNNLLKVNDFYITSEIDLADELAIIQLMDQDAYDCKILEKVNIDLANKIYADAKIVEDYESTGIITNSLKLMHRKFDILRTFIWINNYKIFEQCDVDYTLIVYLYEQDTKDLVKKATQNVWSKVLFEVKQEKGDSILLIPIASDQDIASLDLIVSKYNISSYPALVINNKVVVTEIETKNDVIQNI